jgi:hypothetical protein
MAQTPPGINLGIPPNYIIGPSGSYQQDPIQLPDGSALSVGYNVSNKIVGYIHYKSDGALDSNFGASGFLQLQDNSFQLQLIDSKLWILGGGSSPIYRFDLQGQSDKTFGTNGVLTSPSGVTGMQWTTFNYNGSISAIGVFNSRNVIISFDENGHADTAVGIGGCGYVILPNNTWGDYFQSLADGRHIIPIYTGTNTAPSFGMPNAVLLYAQDWKSQISFVAPSNTSNLYISGSIPITYKDDYIFHASTNDISQKCIFVAYNKDGTLYQTVGNNGILQLPDSVPSRNTLGMGLNISFSDGPAIILDNGDFLLSASITNATPTSFTITGCLLGYTSAGIVDPNFGTSGVLLAPDGYDGLQVVKLTMGGFIAQAQQWNSTSQQYDY